MPDFIWGKHTLFQWLMKHCRVWTTQQNQTPLGIRVSEDLDSCDTDRGSPPGFLAWCWKSENCEVVWLHGAKFFGFVRTNSGSSKLFISTSKTCFAIEVADGFISVRSKPIANYWITILLCTLLSTTKTNKRLQLEILYNGEDMEMKWLQSIEIMMFSTRSSINKS